MILNKMTKCLLIAATLLLTVGIGNAGEFAVYHIGNSLSGDLYRYFGKVGSRYETTQGNTYSWGYHFRPATVLTFIYAHPDAEKTTSVVDLTATSGGSRTNLAPWTTALPGKHWDVVTLQPHPATDQGPNLLSDNIAAINGMIAKARENPANASTRFYIYAAWTQVSTNDPNLFSRTYAASTIVRANPDRTPASASRDFIELLCDRVRQTHPEVGVIPVGEVLYTLDQMMQQGEFDQFSSINQLHRDIIHLNSVGQNLTAWTAYATIFQQSPVGLPYDKDGNKVVAPFSNVQDIDAHDLKLMQQTIWKIVKSMKRYTNVQ
jgi:hypothetical protein